MRITRAGIARVADSDALVTEPFLFDCQFGHYGHVGLGQMRDVQRSWPSFLRWTIAASAHYSNASRFVDQQGKDPLTHWRWPHATGSILGYSRAVRSLWAC